MNYVAMNLTLHELPFYVTENIDDVNFIKAISYCTITNITNLKLIVSTFLMTSQTLFIELIKSVHFQDQDISDQ